MKSIQIHCCLKIEHILDFVKDNPLDINMDDESFLNIKGKEMK